MAEHNGNLSKGEFPNVQVTVRVKPSNKKKISVISKVAEDPKLIKICGESFKFDHVKWGDESQEQVYEAAAYSFVEKALEGYTSTIIAFGQPGSGKSYTMGSLASMSNSWQNSGLMQRCLKHIFEQNDIQVSVSFVEIYNEELHDLLDMEASLITRRGTQINPEAKRIASFKEGLSLVRKAIEMRQERVISKNISTSQSHAIATFHLVQKKAGNYLRVSQINLVDLAGARTVEQVSIPSDEPLGVKYSINRGLSALNNVITAMSEAKDSVPMLCEKSLLTKTLKDSLETESQISLIACLSPDPSDYQDNLRTLQFAKRVKLIGTQPTQRSVINCANYFADKLKDTTKQMSVLLSPLRSDAQTLEEKKRLIAKTAMGREIKNCTVVLRKSDIDFKKYEKTEECKENIATINHIGNEIKKQNPEATSIDNNDLLSLASTVSNSKLEPQKNNETPVKIDSPGTQQSNRTIYLEDNFLSSYSEFTPTWGMEPRLSENKIPLEGECLCPEFDFEFLENDPQILVNYQGSVDNKTDNLPVVKPEMSRAAGNQMKRMNASLTSNFSEFSNTRASNADRLDSGPSETHFYHANKFFKTDGKRLAITSNQNTSLCERKNPTLTQNDNLNEDLNEKKLAHGRKILRILNFGNPKELATLPQIGTKTATVIFQYRLMNGPFNSIEDLKNIPVWSGKLWEKFFAANYIA